MRERKVRPDRTLFMVSHSNTCHDSIQGLEHAWICGLHKGCGASWGQSCFKDYRNGWLVNQSIRVVGIVALIGLWGCAGVPLHVVPHRRQWLCWQGSEDFSWGDPEVDNRHVRIPKFGRTAVALKDILRSWVLKLNWSLSHAHSGLEVRISFTPSLRIRWTLCCLSSGKRSVQGLIMS